jgi:hypothetical protein
MGRPDHKLSLHKGSMATDLPGHAFRPFEVFP